MEHLLIFPFNGNGIEALACIGSRFNFLGFVDDTKSKQGRHEMGFEVLSRDAFQRFPDAKVLAVPGNPTTFKQRRNIIANLNIDESRFVTVVHPTASVSTMAKVGRNVLIMAGVVLTSNCTIGNHVCILPNTVIHHDSSIGDYTLIGSNVSVAGATKLGTNCYIGSGTSIINGISIGDRVLVGMASNVIRSIDSDMKVAGNPARGLHAKPRAI